MTADTQDHDIVGVISRSPWFEGLPDDAHRHLAESACIRSCPRNNYLYMFGETSNDVFCILSGRIRLLLSSELGQEYAITDLEPGAWLGEQFLASDLPTSLDAQINEAATVLVIPRSVVLDVGKHHPQMYQNIFVHTTLRNRGIYTLLLGMAFYPLRSRLAGRFIQLIKEHGQQEDEGIYLDVHLSQNDFAQLSLGSRQRINKILGAWREQGIIELQSRRYLIRDMGGLQAEMELKDHDD